jgi:hypothetical protein
VDGGRRSVHRTGTHRYGQIDRIASVVGSGFRGRWADCIVPAPPGRPGPPVRCNTPKAQSIGSEAPNPATGVPARRVQERAVAGEVSCTSRTWIPGSSAGGKLAAWSGRQQDGNAQSDGTRSRPRVRKCNRYVKLESPFAKQACGLSRAMLDVQRER